MTTLRNNLSVKWQKAHICLGQQDVYMHIIPANFVSDKERAG